MRSTFPESPWGIWKYPFLKIPFTSSGGCEDQQLTWVAHLYRKVSVRNLTVKGQLLLGIRSLNWPVKLESATPNGYRSGYHAQPNTEF